VLTSLTSVHLGNSVNTISELPDMRHSYAQ
jgi:hypothetical protein